jgi:pimeloyl-ACP methyl ester carboxylesterase
MAKSRTSFEGQNRTPPGPRPHGPDRPVVPENTSFTELYPWKSHWIDVSDDGTPLWLHYLDEGPRDAPILLCLHGNPTWSFFWRDVVRALAGRYRVIAIDHVGCGLSDRPERFPYTLSAHARNVGKLVDTLGLTDITLAMHDWGGMIGMTWATAHPEKVGAFVVVNTAAFHGKLPFRIRTVRIPLFGRAAVLGLNAFVRAAMVSCTVKKDALSDAVRAGFTAPYQTARDRLATLRFVEDVPLDPSHPTWNVVAKVDSLLAQFKEHPMCILWGEQDWCFTPRFREGWQERFPAAEVHTFDDGAHFLLEEKSAECVPLIAQFMDGARARGPRTSRAGAPNIDDLSSSGRAARAEAT